MSKWLSATGAALPWGGGALAQAYVGDAAIDNEGVAIGTPHYPPFLDQSYANRVFWGDTHLHTSYSTDAGMIGNTLGPDEAFRFTHLVQPRTRTVIRQLAVPSNSLLFGLA